MVPHPPCIYLGRVKSHATHQPSSFSHFTSPPSSLIYPNHLSFGDSLPVPKLDTHFWIGFCNIEGLPAIAGHNDKVLDVKNFLVAHDLDIFGRCKSNLNWWALPDHIQLWEWFHSADGCRTFHAHNLYENFGSFQYSSIFWRAMLPHRSLLWNAILANWDAGSLVH